MRLVPHQEAPTKVFWSGLNRAALIRVPLAWSEVADIAKRINPQEESEARKFVKSKTVELRSPDGSAQTHLLLAGITMAADWGFRNPDSKDKAEALYVSGRTHTNKREGDTFASLPANCLESSQVLAEKRGLYERDGVFPPAIIDYVLEMLEKEDAAVKSYGRLENILKIMHKDLHKH
jgi:glutamine synthetase